MEEYEQLVTFLKALNTGNFKDLLDDGTLERIVFDTYNMMDSYCLGEYLTHEQDKVIYDELEVIKDYLKQKDTTPWQR
jgi:hypothetical protein